LCPSITGVLTLYALVLQGHSLTDYYCGLHEQGSQVYARALAKAGILTSAEADTIVDGLMKVGALSFSLTVYNCQGTPE